MVSQVGETSPTGGLQWHTAHHSDQHEKGFQYHPKLEVTEQHWRNLILAVGHQKTTRDVRVVVHWQCGTKIFFDSKFDQKDPI